MEERRGREEKREQRAAGEASSTKVWRGAVPARTVSTSWRDDGLPVGQRRGDIKDLVTEEQAKGAEKK